MMSEQNETELNVDVEPEILDKYGYLIEVAKRKVEEEVEKTPRATKKQIWVENDAIHWEVQRASSGGVILGGYKDWVKGSIPISGGDVADKLLKIDKLHEEGKLTDEEFKQAKDKILG